MTSGSTFDTSIVRSLLGLLIFLAHAAWAPASEAPQRGKVTASPNHPAPAWFKESFLEIQEDAVEAGEADKHLMLFFHLNNCPYCDRMLTESFEADPNMSYIRQHFDVIMLNVKGDREVVFNEELTVLEKELAELLEVRGTPAILFLTPENKPVARVNGYRAPPRFRSVLEYVSSKAYKTTTLTRFMARNLTADAYKLRDDALFQPIRDLSAIDGRAVIVFENASCYDCAEFHDRLLAHAEVRKQLARFTVVRLDTDSEQTIVDISGNETTAAALAEQHEMSFRPGVLVFDEGRLVRRLDSLVYTFHFSEGLRYIADGHYKNEDYRSYSQRRREELLAAGVDIDFTE